jgi:hypothetical protein
MFNSREYEWSDLVLRLGGRDLVGARGVKYTKAIEREAVYAKGRNAHSIQSGNVSVTGELTLLQSELEVLITSARNGDPLNLILDLVVAYGENASTPGVIRIDRVEGLQFTEWGKELKQGDKFMEVTLPFIALRVETGL